jgi:hypothetical protein
MRGGVGRKKAGQTRLKRIKDPRHSEPELKTIDVLYHYMSCEFTLMALGLVQVFRVVVT